MTLATGSKLAVIDIGSNSVRLFIFSVDGASAVQVFNDKHFCGLGRDLGTTGRLNPEAADLTLEKLRSFRVQLDAYEVSETKVIGTAALREAADAAQFLMRVKAETGFDIEIIDGEQEAVYAAKGIFFHKPDADGVVADFGGGSLELAQICKGSIGYKTSLNLGAHYLHGNENADALIDRDMAAHPELANARILFITGGAWRSLAKAWLQERGESDRPLDSFQFDGAGLIGFCRKMEETPAETLINDYSIEPPRAELMAASALMLRKLVEKLQPGNIAVSLSGIRDGVVYELISES